jgi:endonuclease/exonuclease/phosphatase family metal-dependent hydrolase
MTGMIGWAGADAPQTESIKLLHWNVRWGGGRGSDEKVWRSMITAIKARSPDVIVLSEAPATDRMLILTSELPGWSPPVVVEHEPASGYWYRLAVLSRWPGTFVSHEGLTGGVLLTVDIDAPGGVLRIGVPDGQSDPARDRTAMLNDLAQACASRESSSEPLDVLAGDFNAPSRSIGFQRLCGTKPSYRFAAVLSGQWRATWPAPTAWLDIDHVLVSSRLALTEAELFGHRGSDHRGQCVTISY